jgi:shikimate dehydrogenase
MDAVYVPMDIEGRDLKELLLALRNSDRVLGINVTVPHKLAVMAYLDEIDPGAARIGAVNTIARTGGGRLIGYNTDGAGFIASLLTRQPGAPAPFMSSLENCRVLVLGAGGSARAVAVHLADLLQRGELIICNRTAEHARDLASHLGQNVRAIDESAVAAAALQADLIVNSTIKGQAGLRRLDNGMILSMEPYSALAPAHPTAVPEVEYGKANSKGFPSARNSLSDIESNQRASLDLAKAIPPATGFYDLIYQPEETVFLRHGRLSGHRTMNGKSMIICQAVAAFCDHICADQLTRLNRSDPATRARITEIMYASW